MRVIEKNFRTGTVKLIIEDAQDAWSLSKLLGPGDSVHGSGYRKVKVTEKDTAKKRYFFELMVDTVEFTGDSVRINGTVLNELDDVPKGSFQSITIGEGDEVRVVKRWSGIDRERLDRACAQNKDSFLIVFFDRESASLLEVRGRSIREVGKISGSVEKKSYVSEHKDFLAELAVQIDAMRERYAQIIFASPQFWIDELRKRVSFPAIYVPVSSAERSSIKELVKRSEVRSQIALLEAFGEVTIMEQLFEQIGKDGLYAYGIAQVERYASAGAIDTVIVSSSKIPVWRESGEFDRIDAMLDACERSQAKVVIIESDAHALMQLDTLGGIAAITRFRMETS